MMKRALLMVILCLAMVRVCSAAPRELWLYCPTNLQVDQNVEKLQTLWRRAATAGYTHVLLTDSKMRRLDGLGGMRGKYMANLARAQGLARELKLQVVPAVFPLGYSNDLLWHDPNLAEGLRVDGAPFITRNGHLVPANDPSIVLGKPSWKDDSVSLSNNLATVTNARENARFVYKLNLPAHRAYHVSAMVRTRHFSGEARIQALADSVGLQYQSLGLKADADWKPVDVVFNTLDHTAVNLYFGIWGGCKGTLEWKDWRIEEAGLVNLLRRRGTPVLIDGATEGKEIDALVDPHMGNHPWPGSYDAWHTPPSIASRLPEGRVIHITSFHPAIIHDEQVMACPSEPATRKLLAEEAGSVRAACGADGYLMSFDEIRVLGQDQSCAKTGQTPGQILADTARYCTGLLKGSTAYVWSDMFDPTHNAVPKDYYLVNGDLRGSWEGLNKDVVIMNWNFGHRDASLDFFAKRGHRQIVAAYYDAPLKDTAAWLKSAKGVPGIVGMMYTTWENRYDDLEAFAKLCASEGTNGD